jgi:antitoxin HigA-1
MASDTVNALPAFKPAHPGDILREDVLPSFAVSKAALARHLQVSSETLYALLRAERSVTPDMAIRLSRALGTSVHFWLNLQAQYDAWHAERSSKSPKIALLRPKQNAAA